MGSFWFKLRDSKNGIEYFADKIPMDTSDLDASTINGEEYYIVTWESKGEQYQDEVLTFDVGCNLRSGFWVKTKEEA